MGHEPYKKTWLVISQIAREMICMEEGDRLPTIQEYTEKLHSSRGIVQNALAVLQQEGAIDIQKHGKKGTFVSMLNTEALFRMGNLNFITGSMPAPLRKHHSGLATGVCKSMLKCPVPFTFAFVHGAGNRVNALLRMVYDFVVVSSASADHYLQKHPELEVILELEDCEYSPPFVLFSNHPGVKEIQDGMTIAADPNSVDQYKLTEFLTQDKNVEIQSLSYISSVVAFLDKKIDFIVYRNEDWMREQAPEFSPFEHPDLKKFCSTAFLANQNNYGVGNILKMYLDGDTIVENQRAVIDKRMREQYY